MCWRSMPALFRPLVKTMKLEQILDICHNLLGLKVLESVAITKIVRPELFAPPVSNGANGHIKRGSAMPAGSWSFTALDVSSPAKDGKGE